MNETVKAINTIIDLRNERDRALQVVKAAEEWLEAHDKGMWVVVPSGTDGKLAEVIRRYQKEKQNASI